MPVRHFKDVKSSPITAAKDTEIQVLISPEESPNFAMRRITMQPGGDMPKHINTVEHEQYVISGSAQVGINDETFEVSAGNIHFIPAGTPHWYKTTGDEPFVFLCMVPNLPDTPKMLD